MGSAAACIGLEPLAAWTALRARSRTSGIPSVSLLPEGWRSAILHVFLSCTRLQLCTTLHCWIWLCVFMYSLCSSESISSPVHEAARAVVQPEFCSRGMSASGHRYSYSVHLLARLAYRYRARHPGSL